MRRPNRTLPLIWLVGVVALGACGGDDDPAASEPAASDPPSSTDPVPSAPTTEPAPTTEAPTTDPEPTVPPTTEPAPTTEAPSTAESASTIPPTTEPATSDDCLVGRWVVTESELNAFYDAVEAQIDDPISFSISGEAGLVFTETTYEWTPAFALELELAGVTGSGVAGGSISGTYTTSDSVLSTEVSESAMTLSIEIAGQTFDGAEIGNGFITSVPFVNSPYSCDGPTPVIMFETIDERHPVTLTPAG